MLYSEDVQKAKCEDFFKHKRKFSAEYAEQWPWLGLVKGPVQHKWKIIPVTLRLYFIQFQSIIIKRHKKKKEKKIDIIKQLRWINGRLIQWVNWKKLQTETNERSMKYSLETTVMMKSSSVAFKLTVK